MVGVASLMRIPLTLALSPEGRGNRRLYHALLRNKGTPCFSPSPPWGEGRGEGSHLSQPPHLHT